nr:DinB family protein [Elizabethkingia anophelis]
MSQKQYNTKSEVLTQASIGQHVRHIVEFYQCLFSAEHTKEVNYDVRQRDLKLETDINFASQTIEGLVKFLSKPKEDFFVTFIADYSTSDGQAPLTFQTTFYRELAYNLEHSIHHQALIKVAIAEMNLCPLIADTFGYAPSTIRHLNQCVQ